MVKSKSAFVLAALAVLLTLLTLGCDTATAGAPAPLKPTPTALVPSPVPSPHPNPAVTPVGNGSGNGVFLTPTPITASLQPVAPEGWAASLIVSGEPNATESGAIGSDGRMYVSWGVTNYDPTIAGKPFSVDLLVDGVPVERWASMGQEAGEVQTVRDWANLPLRAHLSPGPHQLQLWVDSTGYLQPIDAVGNSVVVPFEWPELPNGNGSTALAPERLPNLTPYLPEDWDSSINLQGVPASTDAVLRDGAPGLQIAYRNAGLSSINRFFLVYVYLDGVLVTKFNQHGLIADGAVVSPPWLDLLKTIHITPGYHTLTLDLDPTGLVDEADESDNTTTAGFQWRASASGASGVPTPQSGGEPALKEYVPSGWLRSLAVTSYPGDTASASSAYLSEQAYVSWAMKNEGAGALDSPYIMELLISGEVVHTWERTGLAAGALDVVIDEPIPAAFAPGIHSVTLRARVSGGGVIDIASRPTNWRSGFAPPRASGMLDAEERRSRLVALERIRSSTAPMSSSTQMLSDVTGLVDLVYQTLYNRSLGEESLVINILTAEEFTAWVDAECADVAPGLAANVRNIYLERCTTAKGYVGYFSEWRGASRIVVRGDKPPMEALSAIAHELGHFRQALLNPSLNDQMNLNVVALRESQAYAHQTLFFRTLESLAGVDLLLYPRVSGYENFVQTRVGDLRNQAETSEHARGQLVLWLAILSDPDLRQQRTALLNNRSIPAQTVREVFDHLVQFSPGEARLYVTRLMRTVGAQMGAIESLVTARLISGLPYWNEGSPALRDIGLLLP